MSQKYGITALKFEQVKYRFYKGLIYTLINFMTNSTDKTRALWIFHKYRALHSS
jgi:hypothetical protein